jgi:hypothetical protein
MLDQARKVAGKIQGKMRAEFDADENHRLALAHLVQTIGEAARRVSDSTKRSWQRHAYSDPGCARYGAGGGLLCRR